MNNQTNKEEQRVADKAKQMLTSALSSEISSSFKEHYRGSSSVKNDKNRQPLRDFKVSGKGKNFTFSDTGNKYYFFNALTLKMGKHGFIHNHGANKVRMTHKVHREQPHPSEYVRIHHQYVLKKNDFIDRAIKKSGIIPYVAKEISEIRGYAVLQDMLDKMAEDINKK